MSTTSLLNSWRRTDLVWKVINLCSSLDPPCLAGCCLMLKEFVPDPTVGPRAQWLLLVDLILTSLLPNHGLLPLGSSVQFSSVQLLSRVRLFATPWIAAHQASLSITNFRSLLKFMPIESVMPPSHLILCRPLLLLPRIPPSIRVFSNESILRTRWPKYWSFSFSIIA